jgi:hypothetical protein
MIMNEKLNPDLVTVRSLIGFKPNPKLILNFLIESGYLMERFGLQNRGGGATYSDGSAHMQ